MAGELISSADRALRRGGVAAAAAFWERAVTLTPDPGERAARALAAAEAKYAAGDFEAAQALLAVAEIGPLAELGRAHVQRMRAQVAFALRRGSDAPPLLLRAAQRLQPLDAELARQTYLEALVAAIYAGRLARGQGAGGQGASEIANAAKSAPLGDPGDSGDPGSKPLPHSQLLLRGLAVRLTDGYAAAAPILREALRGYRAQPRKLDWLCVSYNLVAMDLWDDEAWFQLAADQVRLARANGTLSWLPFALDYLAENHIQAGQLSAADALQMEGERIDPGIRAATLPYVPLLLAAWRGDEPTTARLTGEMVRGASARGEGAALTCAEYATAVLGNGLANYGPAAGAAYRASTVPGDRRAAVHRGPHGGVAPAQGVRQAGHRLPPRARRSPKTPPGPRLGRPTTGQGTGQGIPRGRPVSPGAIVDSGRTPVASTEAAGIEEKEQRSWT